MDKKVTVLTPNGRRQNVKITPNTTLLQVLEEASKKHGFASEDYGLKHHNKEVGLSQIFRFSGLPNNCLLEMFETETKRVESSVDICVQLEDGTRYQEQFTSSESLWQVLMSCCSEVAISYDNPVVIYMRQELYGAEKLSSTTLKSLGITAGRALLRFVDKKPENLKIQANVYIPHEVKSIPKVTNNNSDTLSGGTSKPVGFAITKDLVQSLKNSSPTTQTNDKEGNQMDSENCTESTSMEESTKQKYDWGSSVGHSMKPCSEAELTESNESDQMEVEPDVIFVGDRNAIVYSLNSMQKQEEDLPDSFFDLTVNDLKLVLRDLKKVAAGNEDSPLLTAKLRDLEKSKQILNKMALYKNCIIRVQFPDRYVLQGIFKPIDKISDVHNFVRTFLNDMERTFDLFTIPPKLIMPPEQTLLETDSVPTAVFHFAFADSSSESDLNSPFLRNEFLEKLSTPEAATFVAKKARLTRQDKNEESVVPSTSTSSGAVPKRPRNDFRF